MHRAFVAYAQLDLVALGRQPGSDGAELLPKIVVRSAALQREAEVL